MEKHSKLSKHNEYFENTTLHGVSKIYNAKNSSRKLFWIFVLVVSLSYFGFLLQSRIAEYFKFKIKVTTIYEEEFGGMLFPAVTVCNVNRISLRKFIKFFKVSETDVYDRSRCNRVRDSVLKMHPEILYNLSTVEFSFADPYFEFNGLFLKPDEKSIKKTVNVGHGTCFTFNQNGKEKQTTPGSKMSLRMYLNIGIDDYLPCDFSLNEKTTGVNLYIHEPNSEYNMNSFIAAPPGYITRVNVRRSEIERLQTPYIDDCRMDNNSGRDEFPIITSTKYSVSACQQTCLVFKLNKTCGVIDLFSFYSILDKFKDNFKPFSHNNKCIDNFWVNFLRGFIECKCRKPCSEIYFQTTANMATWPSKVAMNEWVEQVSNIQNQSVDEQYIKGNIVALEIFFQEFRTLKTIHSPAYTFDALAADMGGLSGLFIGASVFSIFELMTFLVTLVYNSIYWKMKNKSKCETTEK